MLKHEPVCETPDKSAADIADVWDADTGSTTPMITTALSWSILVLQMNKH